MKELDLSTIPSVNDDVISSVAVTCPQLRVVLLNAIRDVTDFSLLSLSAHTPHLDTLAISMNFNITAEGIHRLVIACPELTMLSLIGCGQIATSNLSRLSAEYDENAPEWIVFRGRDWRRKVVDILDNVVAA